MKAFIKAEHAELLGSRNVNSPDFVSDFSRFLLLIDRFCPGRGRSPSPTRARGADPWLTFSTRFGGLGKRVEVGLVSILSL